jgi:23S rRNA (uridine2552-2'-O)-methyltransferase
MKLEEARRDYYRRLARERGYRSRAAFKLQEAVQKYKLIRPKDKVVDLGAAPGGWLQVASEAVGGGGLVVGVDLSAVSLEAQNVRFIQIDVFDTSVAERVKALTGGEADVLLSDLSPNVSGAWDLDHFRQADLTMRVIGLMGSLLRGGGNAMLKVFEGERSSEIRGEAKARFRTVTIMKPRASRSASSEMYLVCLGHLP